MAKTPNYFLTQPFKELPAGACVRPVHVDYLPKETKERLGVNSPKNQPYWGSPSFNPETEEICYTRLGFMVIEKKIIREA